MTKNIKEKAETSHDVKGSGATVDTLSVSINKPSKDSSTLKLNIQLKKM